MNLLLLSCFFGLLHPFYVSVTEINHNVQDKTLEISLRVFTDDFENTLKMYAPGLKIDLINPPKMADMDSLINKYVTKKMQIVVNGQPKMLRYIGFERVKESVWCYFEINNVETLKTLKIHNPVLYEYKKEQINMIHVVDGDKRQSRKLDNPVADWVFSF